MSHFQFVAHHWDAFAVSGCVRSLIARPSFSAWLAGADCRAARVVADWALVERVRARQV